MKNVRLFIAKDFNELSSRQINALIFLKSRNLSPRLLAFHLLKILANVRFWQFKKKRKIKTIIKQVPISNLQKHFEFAYMQNFRTKFGKPIRIKGKKYYPPAARLSNLTAEEFAVAFDLFNAHQQKPSKELGKLIATVLYVPNVVDDVRPPFIRVSLNARAKRFKVSRKKLDYILFCFSGCLNHIEKKYKHVFPSGKTVNHGNSSSFNDVLSEMAGKLTDLEKANKINVYQFLDRMEKDLKKQKSTKNGKISPTRRY